MANVNYPNNFVARQNAKGLSAGFRLRGPGTGGGGVTGAFGGYGGEGSLDNTHAGPGMQMQGGSGILGALGFLGTAAGAINRREPGPAPLSPQQQQDQKQMGLITQVYQDAVAAGKSPQMAMRAAVVDLPGSGAFLVTHPDMMQSLLQLHAGMLTPQQKGFNLGAGQARFEYDPTTGQPTKVAENAQPQGGVQYGRDAAGNPITITQGGKGQTPEIRYPPTGLPGGAPKGTGAGKGFDRTDSNFFAAAPRAWAALQVMSAEADKATGVIIGPTADLAARFFGSNNAAVSYKNAKEALVQAEAAGVYPQGYGGGKWKEFIDGLPPTWSSSAFDKARIRTMANDIQTQAQTRAENNQAKGVNIEQAMPRLSGSLKDMGVYTGIPGQDPLVKLRGGQDLRPEEAAQLYKMPGLGAEDRQLLDQHVDRMMGIQTPAPAVQDQPQAPAPQLTAPTQLQPPQATAPLPPKPQSQGPYTPQQPEQ